jgi:short-subunit dehydrogenase
MCAASSATKPLAAITGASSGIGMTFARKLAPTHDLLLIARRRDLLESLAAELSARHGCDATILPEDLTDPEALGRVAAHLAAEPRLELFINNAGFGHRGAFWQADLTTLENMHALHITAVLRLTHAVLGAMVARDRGALINVASVAAFAQRAGSASYGATKSWLTTLTEGIDLDLHKARSAVKIQALCPGFTYSGFHDRLGETRHEIAPASLWMTADAVVDASLRGLTHGTLFVVPGWRYKLLLAVLSKLPLAFKVRMETLGSRRSR